MFYINYMYPGKIVPVLIFSLFSFCLFAQEVDRERLVGDIQYLASDELEGRKPLTEGGNKAAQFIRERFSELGLTSQYMDYTQSFALKADRGKGGELGEASNIVGFIPGHESEKLIVITAHYDHLGMTEDGVIFNGADDNASGTAALLAMAEYFSRHK